MATKNLSVYDSNLLPDAGDMKIGIVVSEWNYDITNKLLDGAVDFLLKNKMKEQNISICWVPGSFELIYASKQMAETLDVDAVIALGCVVRGETAHFDYICSGVTKGIADLNREGKIPFVYGLLTCFTMDQALARSGGRYGNKGVEAAKTAIQMIHFSRVMQSKEGRQIIPNPSVVLV